MAQNHGLITQRAYSRRRLLAAGAGGAAASFWLAACGNRKSAATSAPKGVSANAPVTAGVDPESLIPDGIKKYYPQIYQYHWSRMTFSKNPPKYGGVFRTAAVNDGPNWDPLDTSGSNTSAMQLFFNRLLKADMSWSSAFANKRNFFKLLLTGDLADSFEQPDPLTYTFHFPAGIKFHNVEPTNGQELTTDDVKFSCDAFRAPGQTNKVGIFRDVDSIQAVDRNTLKITMKRPAAYFLYSLAGPLVVVFSRQAYEKQGGLQNAKPTGTGPFILDQHDFRSIIRAHKNPDYFVKGRPYLDGMEFHWIPDRAALIAAYRAGQLDSFTGNDTWEAFEDVMRTEQGKTDVNVFQQNSGGQPYFGVYHDKPPFNDLRVRQAISMALDRDAMVKARYKIGRWAVTFPTDWSGQDYPSTPSQFGANYAYNPDEAKKLLAAAGASDLAWTVWVSTTTGQPDDQVALAIEYWKQIGLRPTLKVLDYVAFIQQMVSHQVDGMGFGTAIGVSGTDLDDFAFRVEHSGEANNLFGIHDPQLDALLEAQQREFDRAKREQIGAQILARDFDQVHKIHAASWLGRDFKRPYVQNYVSHDVYFYANAWGSYQLADTWMDK
jgi:peptide/nickel transport system substrate-binding protein